jgi:hypothetical protein
VRSPGYEVRRATRLLHLTSGERGCKPVRTTPSITFHALLIGECVKLDAVPRHAGVTRTRKAREEARQAAVKMEVAV